jgi:WD40 repeat protein
MKLTIKTYTGRQFAIDLPDDDAEATVGLLKETIEKQEEIPEWKQALVFDGTKMLKDDAPLDDFAIEEGSLIWLQINTNLKKPPAAWKEKKMKSARKPAHLPPKPLPVETDAWLVTGGADRLLYLRKIAGLDQNTVKDFDTYRIFQGHNSEITHIACAGDGQRIISASKSELLLWDIPTGLLIRRFVGHAIPITALSCSGDLFLTGAGHHDCERGELKLWDILPGSRSFGECVKDFKGIPTRVTCCALAPQNRNCKLLVSGQDKDWEGKNLVRVWHRKTGRCVSTLDGHTNAVTCCDLAQNGKLVVTGSMDCLLKLWRANTAEMLCTFPGHTDWVTCCAFTPDFRHFISGSRDQHVKMWSTKSIDHAECTKTFFGHTDLVCQCALSPEGSWVATSSFDSTVKMWR